MLQRMLKYESGLMLLELSNWLRSQLRGAGEDDEGIARVLFLARLAWSLARHMPILRMIFGATTTATHPHAHQSPCGQEEDRTVSAPPQPPSDAEVRATYDKERRLSTNHREIGGGPLTAALQSLVIPNHAAVASISQSLQSPI